MNRMRRQKRDTIVRPGFYLTIRIMLYCIIGFVGWLGLRQFLAIDSIEWGLIFTGFSGYCFGFFGGILRLYQGDNGDRYI